MMPPISDSEKWEIKVGQDLFFLNGREMLALRRAMAAGDDFIHFKDYGISTKRITYYRLVSRSPNSIQLPAPSAFISEQDIENWKKFKDR